MTKHTTALAAAALLAPILTAPAHANDWYAKISVGQSEADVSGITLDEGLSYGGAVGTRVGPFRIEGGVSKLSGDFAGVIDADALNYHGTAYLDLPIGDNAALFGGAGVDYVDGEASVGFGSMEADGTGYHWAVGGAYRLSERLTGEVQYRHLSADLESSFGDVDLDASEVTVGLRLAL